jgi:hypothetical protein
MTTKDEQKLHSPSDVQLCDNHTLDLLTPSSDHHDIDALSDAGTYIIEDDVDMAQNNNSEPKMNASSLHRRYVNQTRNRHGTFDIQGLKPATEHTIDRPLVDLNSPTHDLSSSSSSSSSLISPLVENDFSILNSFTHAPTTLLQQQSTQNQIKPAECFGKKTVFKYSFHSCFVFQLFHQHLKRNYFRPQIFLDEKQNLHGSKHFIPNNF